MKFVYTWGNRVILKDKIIDIIKQEYTQTGYVKGRACFIQKGGINMFKLVKGSKQNGTVIRSDICIYCDNIKDHDECTNCDGFLDICFSYDKG